MSGIDGGESLCAVTMYVQGKDMHDEYHILNRFTVLEN
jgi:hypothetical protein